VISKASQEFVDNAANELKKIWVGKLCVVIDPGDAQRIGIRNANGNLLSDPYHYITMVTKDPHECDSFGYWEGKLVRPGQKPQKIGDWYFGDRSKNSSINVNTVVLVVDVIREIGYWAAVILYKENNWKINLQHLALEAKD
jgi:hypothetical protein